MDKSIIIVGGGTGGHIFPAISLRNALRELGFTVNFMTDQRGAQYQVVQEDPTHCVLKTHREPIWIFVLMFIRNLATCLWRFLRKRPAFVISFGGYTALAPMYAAQILRIPTMIHEQNAVLGRSHRANARNVKILATSFPTVRNLPVHVKTVFTGSPLRPGIAALGKEAYRLPQKKEPFRLLVIGGSQGAKVFSEVIPQAVAALDPILRKHLIVIQQARPELVQETQEYYEKINVTATVKPFFEDMEDQYRQAHVIICRSGASTVAELASVGLPAIMIPYPYAMDDHQRFNAEQLEKNGGGWLILEKDFSPLTLKILLQNILKNPAILMEKSERMLRFAKPNAAETLANLVADFLMTKNIMLETQQQRRIG